MKKQRMYIIFLTFAIFCLISAGVVVAPSNGTSDCSESGSSQRLIGFRYQVTATVPVGSSPYGVAVNPMGTKVYVENWGSDNISVIDTTTNTITATVTVGEYPTVGAVSPDGSKVYVTNRGEKGNVSVIDTATNTVTARVPVGNGPEGIAVSSDGKKVYVTNFLSDTVSVIEKIPLYESINTESDDGNATN